MPSPLPYVLGGGALLYLLSRGRRGQPFPGPFEGPTYTPSAPTEPSGPRPAPSPEPPPSSEEEVLRLQRDLNRIYEMVMDTQYWVFQEDMGLLTGQIEIFVFAGCNKVGLLDEDGIYGPCTDGAYELIRAAGNRLSNPVESYADVSFFLQDMQGSSGRDFLMAVSALLTNAALNSLSPEDRAEATGSPSGQV